MSAIDYTQLQQQYGSHYMAWRDGEVIASAETYDELSDRFEGIVIEWDKLIIAYVEPAHLVCVY